MKKKTTTKKQKVEVLVTFKLNSNWLKKNNIIAVAVSKVKGKDFGSGAGFGERDMQFEFADQTTYEKFKTEVRKKCKGVKFTIIKNQQQ